MAQSDGEAHWGTLGGDEEPMVTRVAQTFAKTDPLVRLLREDGPAYKRTLADRLAVSKSTVYNWTSELRDLGVVERTADGYCLTPVGQLHATLYREFGDASERLLAVQSALSDLPPEHVPDTDVFRSGKLVTAETDPDAPMTELLRLITESPRLTALLPAIGSRCLDALQVRLRRDDPVRLVFLSEAARWLRAEHPTVLQSVDRVPDSECLQARRQFSFGLILLHGAETEVAVAAYSDHGHLVDLVRLDSAAAARWACDVVDHYADDAESVPTEATVIEE